ncbi:immunity 49 family protein [Streptomyces sp. NBC_00572]|uniref:immunity 49 family protein n=1 Tax=Streptomyces sp. NBC_00572 TaxID=2903664 RepID=UPI00225522CC|nr:immunity 49 family protein [Streptomyces sp. NBC_00572]MCX4980175.1 immunity 49 family protein [Streptomyces sp. NBC_00572]
MREVTGHRVDGARAEQALQDVWGQVFDDWHDLRYGGMSLSRLGKTRDELLDHVGARTLEDPALAADSSRTVLLTAAECALGVLGLGCFPGGDWDVPLPLVDRTLSSDDQLYDEELAGDHRVPTARTWIDAFALCLISGLAWERRRVIGPLLREDYAPAIREGVPYSVFDSVSEPADLAEMDALCAYLTVERGRYPGAVPGAVPVRRPDAEERARAARALDAAGALGPDQRLLRVLLDDDREAFEQALVDRLVEHRAGVGADPEPKTLLPVGAVALTALAHLAHGWEPGVRSGYLPEALLRAPVSV